MASVRTTLSSALQLGFVAGAAILVYSFVATARESETRRKCGAICLLQPSYAGAERTLPKFELKDLEGRTRKSSDWAGKLVVLNLWTKTCGPCLEEMPALAAARQGAPVAEGRRRRRRCRRTTSARGRDDTLKSILKDPPVFETLIDPDAKVVSSSFEWTSSPRRGSSTRKGIIRARFDGARDWSDAAVVEVVDEIRAGTYCPLSIKEGKLSSNADAVKLCQVLGGAAADE